MCARVCVWVCVCILRPLTFLYPTSLGDPPALYITTRLEIGVFLCLFKHMKTKTVYDINSFKLFPVEPFLPPVPLPLLHNPPLPPCQ